VFCNVIEFVLQFGRDSKIGNRNYALNMCQLQGCYIAILYISLFLGPAFRAVCPSLDCTAYSSFVVISWHENSESRMGVKGPVTQQTEERMSRGPLLVQ